MHEVITGMCYDKLMTLMDGYVIKHIQEAKYRTPNY